MSLPPTYSHSVSENDTECDSLTVWLLEMENGDGVRVVDDDNSRLAEADTEINEGEVVCVLEAVSVNVRVLEVERVRETVSDTVNVAEGVPEGEGTEFEPDTVVDFEDEVDVVVVAVREA